MLNTALCETGIDERFITLSLLVLEVNTGQLKLCSAGHPPVILRRADGTVEELGKDVGGLPLGIASDTNYEQVNVELLPGDVAVVYSDGVTDAQPDGGIVRHQGEPPPTEVHRGCGWQTRGRRRRDSSRDPRILARTCPD